MVIHTLEELKLPYEEKNVADAGVMDELIARGGESTTPYLIDSEHNIEMYESSDIVDYLTSVYCEDATKAAGGVPPGVCSSE